MHYQYAAGFFQLNNTFIGIDHLFQEHGFFGNVCKRVYGIKPSYSVVSSSRLYQFLPVN